MRIALVHNSPSGGAKRAIREWALRLVGQHTLDVFTLSTANHAYCDIQPIVHAHRIYQFQPRRLFRRPWGRLNQLQRWRDLADLERLGRRLADDIESCHYDVVFGHTCLLTVIPAALRYISQPTVYYLHEPIGRPVSTRPQRPYEQVGAWHRRLDGFDPFIRAYWRRLGSMQAGCMHATRLFLANSRFTRESMPEASRQRTKLCPLGVDVEQFKPMGDLGRENYVLSVGELSPRKGFDFVIQSLGRIAPGRRPRLILACNRVEPEERGYIESLALRCGVSIQILVNQSSAELQQLYSAARLCAY